MSNSQDAEKAITEDPVIKHVLDSNKKWADRFDKPMGLGVKKKLVVLTCMDSRLIPEKFLGLDIGDAEVIRNGGGRVTLDVLRSMVICQDLLKCDRVLVIHHTDCGGQALVREHDKVFQEVHENVTHNASLPTKVVWNAAWYSSYLVPKFIRRYAESKVVHPIPDLYQSVVDDVKSLRMAPNIKKETKLYGAMYSTDSGEVTPLCADTGGGLVLTEQYQKAKEKEVQEKNQAKEQEKHEKEASRKGHGKHSSHQATKGTEHGKQAGDRSGEVAYGTGGGARPGAAACPVGPGTEQTA